MNLIFLGKGHCCNICIYIKYYNLLCLGSFCHCCQYIFFLDFITNLELISFGFTYGIVCAKFAIYLSDSGIMFLTYCRKQQAVYFHGTFQRVLQSQQSLRKEQEISWKAADLYKIQFMLQRMTHETFAWKCHLSWHNRQMTGSCILCTNS